MSNSLIETALAKAKINLLKKKETRFYSAICSSLETIITDAIPTAATNGITVKFNPNFFMGLNDSERTFLVAHETLHVAYLHAIRRGDRDKQLFNKAADYFINQELIDVGLEMPKGGLHDPKYKGMTVEQIYKVLEADPKQQNQQNPMEDLEDMEDGQGEGEGEGNGDGQNPQNGSGGMSQQEIEDKKEEIESKINSIISKAIMNAELAGNADSIPPNLKRYMDSLKTPKVNWRAVLAQFVNNLAPGDYTWRRPRKRYLPDYYLPSFKTEKIGRLDFAIDVSGSIGEKEFKVFVNEVAGVLNMMKPAEIGLMQFDHTLTGNETVKNLRELAKVQFKGGGGTVPQVALDAFEKGKAMGLVVLTDGYFSNNLRNPKRPVIWVVYDNPSWTPPFGKVVHIKLTDLM